MGLYDSVDRGKPKPKRLTGPIALCCALFLLFGGLTYWACHHQFRFHAFISDLTDMYQNLIREKPAYGQIICRCEQVTEGEILDAIRRPLGAKSLDGVKRRTRAGMGRCQAGFCSPRVMEILARELHVDQSEITKCGGASRLIVGTNKDKLEEVQDK